ncbi:MAG: nucleotidyl transferase AbiEii/AbiGii toxin family protein [Bacteroidales bacterium]|nr:nucleotidyl transferase AbiEii/AbiGii toxin family protein [Bacteroidales bacterium]
MTDYFSLPNNLQRTILEQVQNRFGLPAQAVEKDLWVTCLLQILFSIDIDVNIIFKGGTSLSKINNLIERFSEDIDIAIDPIAFGFEGDVTKKQIKKLRKQSSLYVKEVLAVKLMEGVEKYGLSDLLTISPEPDGDGDSTYPEPRRIFIHYKSLFPQPLDYLRDEVILEIGSRSLMEPTEHLSVSSLISNAFPDINTNFTNPVIATAAPQKTFLEKACLLHEMFSVNIKATNADRRSRHLYDLERMMDKDFAVKAINDSDLWNSVQHHRSIFSSVKDVDYSSDFRKKIVLCPPEDVYAFWKADYRKMCETMIYGNKLSFDKLMERIGELENRFHNVE